MRIHCFQHVPFEDLASIKDWIKEKEYDLKYTRFFKNEPLPDLNDFDFLIIMGGPMSFDDDDLYPWMSKEKEFLKKAIDHGKTILGICLGAQIIADVIDGSACHGNSREIGWFPVHFSENRNQLGLNFIPDHLNVFHWHGDTFNIPKGAVRIASTEEFPNQAFLYRDCVLALQFHLEVNKESLKLMIENCREELIKDRFVQRENKIMKEIVHVAPNNKIMWRIMDYLIDQTKN